MCVVFLFFLYSSSSLAPFVFSFRPPLAIFCFFDVLVCLCRYIACFYVFLLWIFLINSWLWSFSSSFLVLLSVDSPQHFFLYSLLCGQRVSNAIPLYLMSFFPMRDKSFILARIWIRNPSFSLIVWFWVYGNKAHIVVLNK